MTYRSLNEMFVDCAEKRADQIFVNVKRDGAWIPYTWRQMLQHTRNLAFYFVEQGFSKGDKVCILADTRIEWDIANGAVLLFGGVVVGVYQTLPPNQLQYIVSHSEAKAIVVEDVHQFDKVIEVASQCPNLAHVIAMEPAGCTGRTFEDFWQLAGSANEREMRFGARLDKMSQSVGPDDLATLIYTSGTTGPPKGAMITHANMLAESETMVSEFKMLERELSAVMWLPMAHIMQRANTSVGLLAGGVGYYAESIERLIDNLKEVKPTVFYSVPRVFEKVFSKIVEGADSAGFPKKQIFYWALKVGREVSQYRQKNEAPPALTALRYAVAKKLVFQKVKNALGGRVWMIVSTAAPIAREILEFFHAADLHACEVYGATELTGAVTVNTPDRYAFGTVGYPVKGMEVRIADDGEILARGPLVFKGYYKDEELTREVLSEDGWYATGDVGKFDVNGFLCITDRKKDIIVTSGGKNIAPQNIENALKRSIYVSQAIVHGDKRKYLTCLLTLDPETLMPWARAQGLETGDWKALCTDSKVTAFIQSEVDAVNTQLAKFEAIKYFSIVPDEFTIEGGELTPTMKVKRKIVTAKYAELLNSMYK